MYYLLEASESLSENTLNMLHYCVDFSSFGILELVLYGTISGLIAFTLYELATLLFVKENRDHAKELFLRIFNFFNKRDSHEQK